MVNYDYDYYERLLKDFYTLNMRRLHGRHAATALFAVCLLFNLLLISYQADLIPADALEYLDLMPTVHGKDIMARQLAAATEKKTNGFQSYEWEAAYDEEKVDYRKCALNQPQARSEHGCTVDTDTKIPYCQLKYLKIDSTKITHGAVGGEPLNSVIGREEEAEFPTYLPGAFSTPTTVRFEPRSMARDYWYYLLDVFMALDVHGKAARTCDVMLPGVSLLITRYEYVDMYHSLKDWWNAFMVLPEGKKVDRVIFLDSHAQGYLDPVWKDLFGEEVIHVNALEHDATCLETAVFVPPGYSSVLWPLGREYVGNRCTAMSQAFVNFVVKGYGLQDLRLQNNTILILDQAPHLIHPRSNLTGVVYDNSRLLDIQAKLMDETDAISVQIVDMHKLSFRSQLKLVRQAHILLGFHGSQMSHCMFLQEGATFMEIKDFAPDFTDLIRWRPDVSFVKFSSASSSLIDYEVVPNVKDVFHPGWDNVEGVKRYPPSYYEKYDWSDAKYDWNDTLAGGGVMDDKFGGADFLDARETNPLLDTWGASKVAYDTAEDYRSCALNRPIDRPAHGCSVDPETKIPYCRIQNLRIDVSKIDSPIGGEYLDTVMGRDEDMEFPKYKKGAFTIDEALDIPSDIDKKMFYYLENVTQALTVSPGLECAESVSTPTLFLTRYDYVNLYHTLADWWNAFFVLEDGKSKVQVVFLDAHAKGALDAAWQRAFGPVSFVKQLSGGGVCFDNAIFVPSGYSSVLWPRERKNNMSDPCPVMAKAFVDYFIRKFKLEKVKMEEGRVTIIDRVPSISHPRSDISKESKAIDNLEYVKERIMKETNATVVELINLEQMPFGEQLHLMRKTHILLGHHTAGMSHLLFLSDGAHVLQLQYSELMSDIAKWKPEVTHRTLEGIYGTVVSEDVINSAIIPAVNYAVNGETEKSEKK